MLVLCSALWGGIKSRCLDEDIHLLPDINRQRCRIEAVDSLEHARVSPFGALASKGQFWHDIWLKALKLQRRLQVGVAAHKRRCWRTGSDPPGVVLIDVDADMQPSIIAEQHEWCAESSARGKLAKPSLDLQNAACHRRADCAAFDLDLDLLDLS